jgi:hypothetical protein
MQAEDTKISEAVTRVTRQLPLGTAYPSGTPDYTWVFRGVHVAQDLVFCVVSRSLSLFFWPLYPSCEPNIRLSVITGLASHNNEHWQYTLELMDRTVTKYVKFDGNLCNTPFRNT